MPVTLQFYKVSEKKPQHNQPVILLAPTGSPYHQGYEMVETLVEWSLNEVDSRGDPTGMAMGWCEDHEQDTDNWVVAIEYGGKELSEDDLWMDVDKFWESVNVD